MNNKPRTFKIKMNFIKYLVFCALFITLGCQSNTDKHTDLYNQVMMIHDEVMPRMSDIQTQIKSKREMLGDSSLNTSNRQELLSIISKLEAADEAMWDWMHNFDSERAKSDTAEAYLQSEEIAIKNVRDMMLNAIQNAEHYSLDNE